MNHPNPTTLTLKDLFSHFELPIPDVIDDEALDELSEQVTAKTECGAFLEVNPKRTQIRIGSIVEGDHGDGPIGEWLPLPVNSARLQRQIERIEKCCENIWQAIHNTSDEEASEIISNAMVLFNQEEAEDEVSPSDTQEEPQEETHG